VHGQTFKRVYVPFPGGGYGVNDTNLGFHYRHMDWLGSERLGTTLSRTMDHANAFARYGEKYAGAGASDLNFTGQDQDTVSGLYDFLYREYSPTQDRWISPDPAGMAAVDVSNPQSWNRYIYVLGSPLSLIDPSGLGNENDCPPESCTTVVGVPDNVPTIGFGAMVDPTAGLALRTLNLAALNRWLWGRTPPNYAYNLARIFDLWFAKTPSVRSERIHSDVTLLHPCRKGSEPSFWGYLECC